MAGEVVDGDLDVGQGGVHGGVVEQPGELERQVSSCCHTRGMHAVTKPAKEEWKFDEMLDGDRYINSSEKNLRIFSKMCELGI